MFGSMHFMITTKNGFLNTRKDKIHISARKRKRSMNVMYIKAN